MVVFSFGGWQKWPGKIRKNHGNIFQCKQELRDSMCSQDRKTWILMGFSKFSLAQLCMLCSHQTKLQSQLTWSKLQNNIFLKLIGQLWVDYKTNVLRGDFILESLSHRRSSNPPSTGCFKWLWWSKNGVSLTSMLFPAIPPPMMGWVFVVL